MICCFSSVNVVKYLWDVRKTLAGSHLTGTCGAVVVLEGCPVLVDLTVEQTAPQRQVKNLPLTYSRQTNTC